MPQIAHSSDLAPSNDYLFQSMAHFLLLWYFNNQKDMEASVNEFFASKNNNWYQCRTERTGRKVASDGATHGPLL